MSVLCGCESDYNGDFPESKPKPVVNALLAADSTFCLKLSLPSSTPLDNSFQPISDAVVDLWENSVFLGQAIFMGNGLYKLDSILKSGSSYSVKVAIPGYDTIHASTVIPQSPSVEVHCSKVDDGIGGIDNYQLQLGRPSIGTSGVWLFVTEIDESDQLIESPLLFYSNSSLCDNFNRSLNANAGGGYSFSYDYFLRIHSSMLAFDVNNIEFASWIVMQRKRFAVVSASSDYDNYFRSLFLQKYWSPSADLPFTYQPISVYSNIVGGNGIFAGYCVSAHYLR